MGRFRSKGSGFVLVPASPAGILSKINCKSNIPILQTTPLTDWRYGRGVPVHVPKNMFDSGQAPIHGGTPLTGVKVLGSPGRVGLSHGSLSGWALRSPGSLMVVSGVGHSRESHGSLWGWVGTPGSLWR